MFVRSAEVSPLNMADYEIVPEKVGRFIESGPHTLSKLALESARVEAASSGSAWALPDANFLMVACGAALVAFMMVITVFIYHREKIRRLVTGENRRVGSVYYVRPGISATQPTEI